MTRFSPNSSKIFQLFTLLPDRPREFYHRVAAMVESKVEFCRHGVSPRYETLPWDLLKQSLTVLLSADVEAVLNEEELTLVENEVLCGLRALPQDAPFPLFHNADLSLARLCYMLVRIMRPSSVVETGVCYGVT